MKFGPGKLSKAVATLTAMSFFCVTAVQTQAAPNLMREKDDGLQYGVVSHLWYLRPHQILVQLQYAQHVGASIIRWDAQWSAVEKTPGAVAIPPEWDYAVDTGLSMGIQSSITLDLTNKLYAGGHRPLTEDDIARFKIYAIAVVTHFHDRVHQFELWNEWDQNLAGAGIGTAAEYVHLVQEIYPALKAIAPDATFLVGGVSQNGMQSLTSAWLSLVPKKRFLEDELAAGVLNYGDGLSIHPYAREPLNHEDKMAEFTQLVRGSCALVAKYAPGKPVMITELGWPTGTDPAPFVSEEEQKALFADALKVIEANKSCVREVIVYQLWDPGDKPHEVPINYGLIDFHGRVKPAGQYLSEKFHRQ